jgi:hypothetical protein
MDASAVHIVTSIGAHLNRDEHARLCAMAARETEKAVALCHDAMGKKNEAAYLTKLLKENAVPSEGAIEWARKTCRQVGESMKGGQANG